MVISTVYLGLTSRQVHMLDLECFTYLNRALESSISPIVILATNRGLTSIKGSDGLVAAHGIPPDLLPRLLIIPTHPYNASEIRQIVSTRATLEYSTPAPAGLQGGGLISTMTLADDALDELTKQGERVSLRYALQLLSPAGILARSRGSQGNVVSAEDVNEATSLFWDAGRSAGTLKEANGAFIS